MNDKTITCGKHLLGIMGKILEPVIKAWMMRNEMR